MAIPTITQSIKYATSLPISNNSCVPSNCRLTAIEESNTISIIANRSSTTSIPKATFANLCLPKFMSSMALNTMVVDDILIIPPRNNELISFHPSNCPNRKPTDIIPITIVPAAINAVLPTCNNFLKLNSNPIANKRNNTPISPHVSTLVALLIHEWPNIYGPVIIPATIYPSTTGCLHILNNRLVIPAVSIIIQRS